MAFLSTLEKKLALPKVEQSWLDDDSWNRKMMLRRYFPTKGPEDRSFIGYTVGRPTKRVMLMHVGPDVAHVFADTLLIVSC